MTTDLARPWQAVRLLLEGTGARLLPAYAFISVSIGLVEGLLLSLLVHVASALSDSTEQVILSADGLLPRRFSSISFALLAITALALVRAALQLGAAYVPANMVAGLQARLRNEISQDFIDSSWAFQSRERDGYLQDVLTAKVSQAAFGLGVAINGVGAAATFIALVVAALVVSPITAIWMIVIGAFLFGALRPVSRRLRRSSAVALEAHARYAFEVNETVRLAEEVSAFGVQDAKTGSLKERADSARRFQMRSEFWSRAGNAIYQLLAILLVLGGLALIKGAGKAQAASLSAVILVLVRALSYAGTAQNSIHAFNQFSPSVDAVLSTKAHYGAGRRKFGNKSLSRIESIEFRQVSFEYRPSRPVVCGASFAINRGEAVGLVGPSGSGKSTCLQLLLRLHTPTTGEYLVNRTPAQDFLREDWTRLVAFLPQDANVISASVADNIRFFRDGISDEQVEEAARLAHVHEDIVGLPNGYQTVIGQRADALSGGQRQRVCLARALVGQPEVLILDEPTSALDSHSEALVRASLEDMRGSVTLVIVAHRYALLRNCDRVFQFRGGRLELLKDSLAEVGNGQGASG